MQVASFRQYEDCGLGRRGAEAGKNACSSLQPQYDTITQRLRFSGAEADCERSSINNCFDYIPNVRTVLLERRRSE